MARKRVRAHTSTVDSTGLNETGKRTLAMLTHLEDEDKLSIWEVEFVGSMIDWFIKQEKALTPKQFARLEIVYGKYN
jgi:hypothetical protein